MQTRSKADKRKEYRAELAGKHQIEVILAAGGREVPGRLLDASKGGLAAAFARESDPGLEPGVRARAKIRLLWLDRTLDAGLVEIKHRTEEDDRIRYGFQFADPGILAAQLDPSLWPYFNQRAAFRVQPDPASLIEVTLEWEGGSAVGRLSDLSTGGMGLTLDPETDLPREAGLSISFAIPGRESPMRFTGVVRNMRPQGEHRCYGIQFVEEVARTFRTQQQGIASYVMQRQQEALRDRKARP